LDLWEETIMSRLGWSAVPPAAALCLTLLAGPALAGQPRTHDGFFLRLSAGMGGANTENEILDGDIEFSGRSGDANIAIGGVVASNLAIHGTLFGWSTSDPDVEFDDFSGEIDGDLSMSGWGGGATYYFMPVNIYLSGSVGAAWMSIEGDPLFEGDSDTGIAGEITLGKEWWVGGSWGLGVAGAFGFHSIPGDDGFEEDWTGNSWAIRFSATLN
jgi:hypothetical protein